MLRIRYELIAAIALLLILASCRGTPTPQQGTHSPASVVTPQGTPTQVGSGLQHIFYIMMENHSVNDILGNIGDAPYLNQLAKSYGVALQYFGVTHPSLPNYLAAISGDFQGIWDDCAAGGRGAPLGERELLPTAQHDAVERDCGRAGRRHMRPGS